MKRLVLQWRSLAQQSPSTSNGIPSGNPSSLSPSPPSPQSTISSSTSSQNSLSASQDSQVPPLLPDSSHLSPSHPPPPPPPRAPSSNPTSHRKRLLQRLSTVKNHPNTPYPPASASSSLQSSVSVSLPSLSSSQNHTVASVQSSISTTTCVPSLALSSTSSSTSAVSLAESASVSTSSSLFGSFFEIPEGQSLIVKVPLLSVTLSGSSGCAQTAAVVSHSTSQANSCLEQQNYPSGHTNSLGSHPTTHTNSCLEQGSKKSPRPRALIVSYSRDLLKMPTPQGNKLQEERPLSSTDQGTSSPELQPPQNLRASLDSSTAETLSQSPSPSPPGPCSDGHGCYGADGTWYSWTQCIIHKDSYSVNVLPYVYIDDLDDPDVS